jgi:hypothetical protein
MEERRLKVGVNLSWHLIWILALLEGITVPLVPLFLQNEPTVKPAAHTATATPQLVLFVRKITIIGMNGMSIGFIGTLIVCLLLNYIALRRIKIHLNGAAIVRVANPFITGLWGGVLLTIAYWIQLWVDGLLTLPPIINTILYGFVSAAGSIVITCVLYLLTVRVLPRSGIQLVTTEQRLSLSEIPIVSFAILIGLYEGLAMPIFRIWELAPHYKVLIALLVGLSGGALSSLIVVALAQTRAMNKHMWLKFSIPVTPGPEC